MAFVPLSRCNLADMESYTAGKSWIREGSKCVTLEKESILHLVGCIDMRAVTPSQT